MNNTAADNGIPLLTEILEVSIPDNNPTDLLLDDQAPLPALETAVMPAESAIAPDLSNPAAAHFSAHDWERMEAEISDRISRQVLGRIDFVLEQRVRDSLSDVLQVAVEGLALEIKRGLHHTLEEVIARAVAQEIARFQTAKY